MVLEYLLTDTSYVGPIAKVEYLPTDLELRNLTINYLISRKVEGISPRTLETYCMVLAALGQFFVTNNLPRKIKKVTTDHLRLFLLFLQGRNLTPETIHIYYRSIKTFFNWLESEGHITENPIRKIKTPRVPKKIIKPFTSENIDDLLTLCSGNGFLDVRNRAIVLLFLDTGLRLSELANIRLVDMNTRTSTIRVMGKGSKERTVRFGKTTQRALMKYLLMRSDLHPCFWVTEERKPLSVKGVQTVIERLCARAGIQNAKRGPHTFRHTAAINFLRNGGGQFSLQLMLGHSTLEMTRQYVSTLGVEDMIRDHEKASPVDNLGIR